MKVVCFGGGNALPNAILKEIKNFKKLKVTSITSMVDDGGSSGILRKKFNVLPPGDIRRHLLAFSNAEEWKKEIWEFRLNSHPFGNLFLAYLEKKYGFEKALEIAAKFLKISRRFKCLPATLDKVKLFAKLENGKILKGEHEIDVAKNRDGRLKIIDLWIKPKAKGYEKAIKEIKKANLIIIGPGDLYSSIIPCFLPEGIKEACLDSNAKKIFICPAQRKYGETYNFFVEDFYEEFKKYAFEPDLVIYNKKNSEKFKDLVFPRSNLDNKKFAGLNLIEEQIPVYNSKILVNYIINYNR